MGRKSPLKFCVEFNYHNEFNLGNAIHIQKNLIDKLRPDKSQMHIPHNICHWSMFRLLIRDVKSVGNMADRLCAVSLDGILIQSDMYKKFCSNCSTSISEDTQHASQR